MCFLLGAALTRYFSRVAHCYAALINKGVYPDTSCLITAMRTAMNNKQCFIISGAGLPWLTLFLSICSGAVLASVFVAYWSAKLWAIYILLCAVLMLLAYIDSATYLLPDAITQPLLWCGLAYAWYGYGVGLNNAFSGAVIGYCVPALLSYVWLRLRGQRGMGCGDVKLLAAIGAWIGDSLLVTVILVASVISIVFAMVHQRSLVPSGVYPFGPFISAATLAVLLLPLSTIG